MQPLSEHFDDTAEAARPMYSHAMMPGWQVLQRTAAVCQPVLQLAWQAGVRSMRSSWCVLSSNWLGVTAVLWLVLVLGDVHMACS
jgi:uncharacterized membrane protein